ncbi:mitochondrial uncoupling protein 4-like [Ptychodera flava]|uniref:mitochondrial uncoupling protein 4-like n=1 Tax=Ptychodera flava TaxID=63121 RepID=UPI00396A1FB5
MATQGSKIHNLRSKSWLQPDSPAGKYVLSSCAATIAELVTFPLDLTKTRLQTQGEAAALTNNGTPQNTAYRGMVRTAIGVVEEEGLFKLWQGITPAIYRHIVYTGVRMGSYEYIRDNVFGKREDGTFEVWKAVLCGMTAGGLGQFIASPADLVKVQMQMEGRRRLEGKPPRIKSAGKAFRLILKQGGVRALWKGWVPNVQRAALVNLGDLTTYDSVKHRILKHTSLKDNWVVHSMSSGCAGLVAASMSTPADVIKTRVMNQPTDKHGRGLLYKNSIDCLLQAVKKEGFFSLYKGFLPTWARMAPWSLTFWLSYEEIRSLVGARSF